MQRLQYAHQKFPSLLWPHALLKIIGWDKKKVLVEFIHIHPDIQGNFLLIWFCILARCAFLDLGRDSESTGMWTKLEKWWIIWRKFHSSQCEFISLLRTHQVPFFCSKLRLLDEVKFSLKSSKKSIKLVAGGTWVEQIVLASEHLWIFFIQRGSKRLKDIDQNFKRGP